MTGILIVVVIVIISIIVGFVDWYFTEQDYRS